jgi:uncharacterized protein (TIGR03437 family)
MNVRYFLCKIAICLISPPFLPAQFHSLATTDDGGVVYFDTALRQKGTNQPLHGKIFRYGSSGINLHASREQEPPPPAPPVGGGFRGHSNYYRLGTPDVSGDGAVVSITKGRDCYGAAACVANELTRSEIQGVPGRPDFELSGWTRLSQNGRYAVHADGISGPSGVGPAVADLLAGTGTAFVERGSFGSPGRVISNSGEFVYASSAGLQLVTGAAEGALQPMTLLGRGAEQILGAVMDAAGEVIVYCSRWPSPYDQFTRLRVFNRQGNTIRTLIEGYGDYYQPVVSNDGLRVLFLSTATAQGSIGEPQAFVIASGGSGPRQLTDFEGGVLSATLSGDGRIVWAVTGEGRLIRIEVESASVIEAIGRTPSISFAALVRGSLGSLAGTGLVAQGAGAATLPLPRSLAGFAARVNGVEIPVYQASPTSVGVQCPWELAPGSYTLDFDTDALSGWDPPPVTVRVDETRPAFLLAGPYPPVTNFSFPFVPALAVHEDWSALVSAGNPARRGEIIHLYATGLGPVNAPVRTGEPTRAEPRPALKEPPQCFSFSISTLGPPLPVLYAGLAPGWIGLYQIDLGIRGGLDPEISDIPGFLRVECESREGLSFGGLVPIAPALAGPAAGHSVHPTARRRHGESR